MDHIVEDLERNVRLVSGLRTPWLMLRHRLKQEPLELVFVQSEGRRLCAWAEVKEDDLEDQRDVDWTLVLIEGELGDVTGGAGWVDRQQDLQHHACSQGHLYRAARPALRLCTHPLAFVLLLACLRSPPPSPPPLLVSRHASHPPHSWR
eukprot:380687-Hanusia_phi.AAC.5